MPQGTITVLDWSRISHARGKALLGKCWANSRDLPAVDILNLIHKAAAAMWPPATTLVATCIFFCFSGTAYRAFVVTCNLE